MAEPILIGDLMRRNDDMKTLITPQQRRRDVRRDECQSRLDVLLRIAKAFRDDKRGLPSHIYDEIVRLGGAERAQSVCLAKKEKP